MRSPSLDHPDSAHEVQPSAASNLSASAAGRFWRIVLGAFALILLLAIIAAVRSSAGDSRNRGPANEAAPGAHPARDIDRSLNR
jgi:hypothetical protein